jgi:HEAT repeat protein
MCCIHGLVLLLLCASVPIGKAAETSDSDDPPPPVGVPLLRELGEQAREEKGPTLSEDGTLVDGKPIDVWIKASKSGDAKVRREAVFALDALSAKHPLEAFPVLLELAGDHEGLVWHYAWMTLRRFIPKDEKTLAVFVAGMRHKNALVRQRACETVAKAGALATNPLTELLVDDDAEVREDAADLLGKLGEKNPDVATALHKALADRSLRVRLSAAEALWRVEGTANVSAPVEALDDCEADVQRRASELLFKMGPAAASAAPELGVKLREGNRATRHLAGDALSRMGKAAVPALALSLGSESPQVRMLAAAGLAKIGSEAKAAVPALHGLLQDDDLDVRLEAAEALLRITGEWRAIVPVVLDIQRDDSVQRRCQVVQLLSYLAGRSAPAAAGLLAAATDPHPSVRCRALEALGGTWFDLPEAAVEVMVGSLKDSDEQVRIHASQAVYRAGWKPFPAVLRMCQDDFGPAREMAFLSLPNRARMVGCGKGDEVKQVTALCLKAVIEDAEADVRCAAARQLEECPLYRPTALPVLLRAAKDSDPRVRGRIASVLANLGGGEQSDTEVAPALIALLQDPDADVRRLAAVALKYVHLAPEISVPALIQAISDPDEKVRLLAVQALSIHGADAKPAIPRLMSLLGDANLTQPAAEALVFIGVDAVPALAEAVARGETDVRVAAANSLARIGRDAKRAVPQLQKAMGDRNKKVREHAAAALEAIDPELAKKLLVS